MSDGRKASCPSWSQGSGTVIIGGMLLFVFLGWSLVSAQTTGQRPLFADDMEHGAESWSTSSRTLPEQDDYALNPYPWARTTAVSHSGTHAWADSPGGPYQNNVLTALHSPLIDLTGVEAATLTFWHRYAFANGDEGTVIVQWGNQWDIIQSFSGSQTTWQQVSLDLRPFVGQSLQIFFYVTTDATETADGWYIDDVVVSSSDFETSAPDPHFCVPGGVHYPCGAGEGDCDPGQWARLYQ